MRRLTRSGCCLIWGLAGVMALIALCAALAAGLFVIGEVSAGAPVAHLPTPVVVHTPGAVVEWRRPMPTAMSETGGGARPWMEVSSTGLTPTSTTTPGENLPPAAGSQPVAGLQVRLPVNGPVTQGYGCSPYYTGIPGPDCPADAFWFHDGVDIAAPVGTPVQAGMAGTVIFAGPDGDGPLCNRGYRGYGLAVIVRGEGWEALYAHLSRIDVEVGQVVTTETPIGASGDTGCVSGAHLHFGLRRDGELVDPMEFVQ